MAAIIEFFAANLGTIAVLLILAALLTLVAVKIAKDKKKGASTCGCGCSSCPYSGRCHDEAEKSSEKN